MYSANLPTGYWAYTITDLGDLGGGTAVAYAINSIGQVVGYSTVPGGANHAFLYSSGQMRDLGSGQETERLEQLAQRYRD